VSRVPRRLLSISHSYVVGLNRRLPDAMARAGGWDVTVVAPRSLHGDFGRIAFEADRDDAAATELVPVWVDRFRHGMLYGRRLRTVLRAGWDLVHCWEEPYVLAGGQVSWLTPAGVPLVYATFQNISKQYPPPLRQIERAVLRRATGWIAFGQTVADALRDRDGYVDRPHRIIPPGVDLERFAPDPDRREEVRRRLGFAEGHPVIGFAGRFVPQKGLEWLMQVLDDLAGPWNALFVGGGPQESAARAWAARHGHRARIAVGVRHGEMPGYFGAMDVLCVPSRTTARWKEQFGRVIVEAMACGVPVVASDTGEIPFVVGDGGMIVAERDREGWIRALAGLVNDPARRAAVGARGLGRARREFALPVVARRHLDFFEELLARQSRP
jgi:phosphatidyl-myo-inositol dimannoside synthase